MSEPARVGVGAIVFDGAGRLLLIERARPPAAGCWSVPGGRLEPGETLAEGVEREVLEETGLTVRCRELVGAVERIAHDQHWVILDYRADLLSDPTTAQAGDDAADVAWVPVDRLHERELVHGLLEFLAAHGLAETG